MYELIIVGGGPAGMAAAVYAARKLLNTLLISSDIGGQVNWTNGVENYLGYQFIEGDELISKFQQQVNQFPIDQKIGQIVTQVKKIDGGFEVIAEKGDKFQGKSVILASGKTSPQTECYRRNGVDRARGNLLLNLRWSRFYGSESGSDWRREFSHRSGP